ncbi:cytochrome c biogenesis CcdA family protein [Nostocoides sp. HKS02]|uniref:cytochrome c biogenesis CcdA family protein n=1 Tax=Nostocoides sp. HKS02 TaxID=1813880 RepID=UPI0012B4DDF0|nr:cytochrome c biogenesis protein CcdA [Tetrasphaera sp. HKS02]QGN58490.1 hypothetical protein GKE56_12010 [Tetrasphaera sp. HKS02]
MVHLVIAILTAFASGFLVIASPCTLPIRPGILTTLGIRQEQGRRTTTARAGALMLFVLGVAGGLAGATGVSAWAARGLPIAQPPWSLLPAGLLLFAGLFTLELLPTTLGALGTRPARFGRGAPGLTGLALGVGWTPCNTPSMALGLMAASHGGSWGFALALIGAYVAGVVVPVAGTLVGVTRISGLRQWLQRAGRGLQVASGLSLVVLAALVGTGTWQSVVTGLLVRAAG